MAEISLEELEKLVRLKDHTQLWWNLPRSGEQMRSLRLTIQSDVPPRVRIEELLSGAQILRDVVVDIETLFTLIPLLERVLLKCDAEA